MLKDILTDNRTCRTFDESRKVTKDELVSFVECARLTPVDGEHSAALVQARLQAGGG